MFQLNKIQAAGFTPQAARCGLWPMLKNKSNINDMKKSKKYWMLSSAKSSKVQPSESDKKDIQDNVQSLVESFKKQYISKNPNREFNYLVDVYSKWFQKINVRK
jgi:hypothetical protein